jgi:hypothetical protein
LRWDGRWLDVLTPTALNRTSAGFIRANMPMNITATILHVVEEEAAGRMGLVGLHLVAAVRMSVKPNRSVPPDP